MKMLLAITLGAVALLSLTNPGNARETSPPGEVIRKAPNTTAPEVGQEYMKFTVARDSFVVPTADLSAPIPVHVAFRQITPAALFGELDRAYLDNSPVRSALLVYDHYATGGKPFTALYARLSAMPCGVLAYDSGGAGGGCSLGALAARVALSRRC